MPFPRRTQRPGQLPPRDGQPIPPLALQTSQRMPRDNEHRRLDHRLARSIARVHADSREERPRRRPRLASGLLLHAFDRAIPSERIRRQRRVQGRRGVPRAGLGAGPFDCRDHRAVALESASSLEMRRDLRRKVPQRCGRDGALGHDLSAAMEEHRCRARLGLREVRNAESVIDRSTIARDLARLPVHPHRRQQRVAARLRNRRPKSVARRLPAQQHDPGKDPRNPLTKPGRHAPQSRRKTHVHIAPRVRAKRHQRPRQLHADFDLLRQFAPPRLSRRIPGQRQTLVGLPHRQRRRTLHAPLSPIDHHAPPDHRAVQPQRDGHARKRFASILRLGHRPRANSPLDLPVHPHRRRHARRVGRRRDRGLHLSQNTPAPVGNRHHRRGHATRDDARSPHPAAPARDHGVLRPRTRAWRPVFPHRRTLAHPLK